MENLNYDCFEQLLKYLPASSVFTLRCVSQKWQTFMRTHYSNYRSLSIRSSTASYILTHQLLPIQIHCADPAHHIGQGTKHCCLLLDSLLPVEELEDILSYFPSLEVLTIDFFSVRRRLKKYWQLLRWSNIRHLNVLNCISLEGLKSESICHLELHNCIFDHYTDQFQRILRSIPELEVLIIQSDSQVNCTPDLNIDSYDERTFHKVCSLSLVGSHLSNDILNVVYCFKNLRTLILPHVRSNQLSSICSNLPRLEVFEFYSNIVELDSLSALHDLRSLTISCTQTRSTSLNSCLNSLECPLRTLSIKCLAIDNHTVNIISRKWPDLICLRLHNGNIGSSSIDKYVANFCSLVILDIMPGTSLSSNSLKSFKYFRNGSKIYYGITVERADELDLEVCSVDCTKPWIAPLPSSLQALLCSHLR